EGGRADAGGEEAVRTAAVEVGVLHVGGLRVGAADLELQQRLVLRHAAGDAGEGAAGEVAGHGAAGVVVEQDAGGGRGVEREVHRLERRGTAGTEDVDRAGGDVGDRAAGAVGQTAVVALDRERSGGV